MVLIFDYQKQIFINHTMKELNCQRLTLGANLLWTIAELYYKGVGSVCGLLKELLPR